MRETHPASTTSLAGPPYDHTHPRHSREGGNLPTEAALLPPATKPGKIRQNPAKPDGNSCVRVHARARGNGTPFPFSLHGLPPARIRLDSTSIPPGLVIPASTHVIPAGSRHSRIHPRHSRRVSSFPHPPTSFPRRRESNAPRRIGHIPRSPAPEPCHANRLNETDRTASPSSLSA